jgi:hypothetical protein
VIQDGPTKGPTRSHVAAVFVIVLQLPQIATRHVLHHGTDQRLQRSTRRRRRALRSLSMQREEGTKLCMGLLLSFFAAVVSLDQNSLGCGQGRHDSLLGVEFNFQAQDAATRYSALLAPAFLNDDDIVFATTTAVVVPTGRSSSHHSSIVQRRGRR